MFHTSTPYFLLPFPHQHNCSQVRGDRINKPSQARASNIRYGLVSSQALRRSWHSFSKVRTNSPNVCNRLFLWISLCFCVLCIWKSFTQSFWCEWQTEGVTAICGEIKFKGIFFFLSRCHQLWEALTCFNENIKNNCLKNVHKCLQHFYVEGWCEESALYRSYIVAQYRSVIYFCSILENCK